MAAHTRPAFETVLDILTRHDPEGLIGLGAPADEYEPEARDLTARMASGLPITHAILARVWADWFGDTAWLLADASAPARAAILTDLAELTP